MPLETFTTGYETLFQVQILHRYFLNVGTTPFDLVAPPMAAQLALAAARRAYDVDQFWRIVPDAETSTALRNARLVFRLLPDGFRVGIPTGSAHHPMVPLPDALTLTFLVYLNDPYFTLYTDIDRAVLGALARPAPAVPQGQVFRWTNTGDSPALNANETIQAADLRPRPATDGSAGPPLGIIEIRHRPARGPSLLDATGRVLGTVFGAVLRNRTTHWEYEGTDVGLFPLVRAGRVAASGGNPAHPLPNPTPATTADRGSDFFSVIY